MLNKQLRKDRVKQKGAVVTTSFGVRKWNPRQAWHWWRKHPEAILLPGPLQEGLPLVQLCVPVWFFLLYMFMYFFVLH